MQREKENFEHSMTVLCHGINIQESEGNGPIYIRKLELLLVERVSKEADQNQSPSSQRLTVLKTCQMDLGILDQGISFAIINDIN